MKIMQSVMCWMTAVNNLTWAAPSKALSWSKGLPVAE